MILYDMYSVLLVSESPSPHSPRAILHTLPVKAVESSHGNAPPILVEAAAAPPCGSETDSDLDFRESATLLRAKSILLLSSVHNYISKHPII